MSMKVSDDFLNNYLKKRKKDEEEKSTGDLTVSEEFLKLSALKDEWDTNPEFRKAIQEELDKEREEEKRKKARTGGSAGSFESRTGGGGGKFDAPITITPPKPEGKNGNDFLLKPYEYGNTAAFPNTQLPKTEEKKTFTPVQASPNERTWFQKGAFEDGYDPGDVIKTFLATGVDIGNNVGSAVVDATENLIDTGAHMVGTVGGWFDKGFREDTRQFIAKDLLKAEQSGKWVGGVASGGVTGLTSLLAGDSEENSVLGEKSDGLVQSAAHLAGSMALQYVGVPMAVTMGVNAFGSEIESAFQQDATWGEGTASAAITTAVELLTEQLFGGIKFGGGTLDDATVKPWLKKISNKAVRTAAKLGVDVVGEGSEEILAGLGGAIGKKLTYADEKELSELFSSEEAWESFIGGAVLGGGMGSVNAHKSSKAGVDTTTGLTANEEAVVDKIYKDRIAEAEKNGKKLKVGEKAKLYDSIVEEMTKGDLSTDEIDAVLGGDTYKAYKDILDTEESLRKEYDELADIKKSELTTRQEGRLEQIQRKLRQMEKGNDKTLLKSKLDNEMLKRVKGDRLSQSYIERYNRGQAFTADVSKYDEKQQAIIQRAMDSGILNNTRKTHEFVDLIAKISADKGLNFDFTNNARLKESGFAMDGVVRNGYVTKDGITLNVQAAKALNKVVGHEVTHVLEGTELYKELQDAVFKYAQSKGEYDKRLKDITDLYKKYDPKADPKAELTADLVGDYLFTDADFINNLSAKHRNVAQKIYDQIKYMVKVATKGSKEARELEKVKHLFEEAYRNGGKQISDAKNSISETTDGRFVAVVDSDILSNIDTTSWDDTKKAEAKKAASDALKQFSGGIVVEGITRKVNKVSRREYTKSNYTESLYNKAPDVFADKMRAADVADDIVIAATDWQRDGGLKHPRKDNFVDFDHGKTLIASGNAKYTAEVIVGITDTGKAVFYDVVDMTPATFDIKKEESPTTATTQKAIGDIQGDSSFDKVAQEPPNVNKQYGLNDPTRNSLSDSEGRQLSNEQSEYFKDSGVNEVTEEQNEQGLDRKQEVQYSLAKDTKFSDDAIALNNKLNNVDPKVMNAQKVMRERVAKRLREMVEKGVALPADKEGKTFFPNKSYGGTEENTLVCPRSLAPEAFMDAVSEYIGRPLTVEEQIYVGQDLMSRMGSSEELRGQSFLAQCVYCYVAADRMAQREYLGEYINQRDAFLDKVAENPNVDVSQLSKDHRALAEWFKDKKQTKPVLSEVGMLYEEFLDGRKPTTATYKRVKSWIDAYKNGKPMIDGNHLANIDNLVNDLSSFDKELIPQIKDAWKYAQSASWAKTRTSYVAYNGHILKWDQQRINSLNEHYGLRLYSFADFHPAFVLENMQMITDASVRGLKMLAYTKDMDFVEIFAPSGININVSTFGLEKNGNVYEDNRMGAEWEKAKALREQHPNVGITFVATNDNMVKWAVKQDWIDVVIPYHMVKTGQVIAEHFGYQNYTQESADKKGAIWKNDKNWSRGHDSSIAPTVHNNDLNTYLAALEANGLEPRFKRFLEDPETRPYYMKLVNENRLSASESRPVQPKFNEEAIERTLARLESEGYYTPIGGSVERMYEIAAEVGESMIAPTNSLSTEGSEHPIGNYNVYGSDIALENTQEDIAPVREDTAPIGAQAEETIYRGVMDHDDVAPVQESDTRTTRQKLHGNIISRIKSRFEANGFDFDSILKNAKNLSTWSTVDNTPQRVMEKALGYKAGRVLGDITVDQVARNETEAIKWLNSFTDRKNGLLAQISKEYKIKPGSKASAAAQMYAEGFYVDDKNQIIKYGDAELAKDFPNVAVQENIKRLASDQRIRKIYDDTLAMINESRTRNAYPEIPRLDNYFLHFRAMDDTFSRLGLPFNPNDIRAKDLPTDLNGVTADLKPGQPYFASAMHRKGIRTSFDLLGGLEKYLTSAKNQIFHIDDIQTFRALRNYIADTYGQANGLEGLDLLTEEEAQERISQVYGSHLSTFAKFLNEEANVLAGKTALIDRGLEGIIGRRGITFLDSVNRQVGANMVGLNVSSSLTNFLAGVQAIAKTNKVACIKSLAQTTKSKMGAIFGKTDSFVENNPTIIRRKGADRFYRTPYQKIGDAGYILMSAVDDVTTEFIVRAKYNEFIIKGMSEEQAVIEADKWTSRLMGDRSLGQMPQLYNSKMLGLVTKFQLEVRNQLDSQFYDTIQETKASNEYIQNGLARNAKTAAQVTSTMFQLAVLQHLFGKAFESVAGYNPAFDIIGVLATMFGLDDDEESKDTALDNVEQGFLALLEDLPYTSTFTGGRIPISSALPIKEVVKGVDDYGNEKNRLETIAEAAPYYILPGGYGQLKKTAQGLSMFDDDHPIAGSYTDKGDLRFPVKDTLGSKVQAGVFGQWASKNARDYFDKGWKPINEKQQQEFIDSGMTFQEYHAYRDGLKDFTKEAEKVEYINGLDLTDEQKIVLKSYLFDEAGYAEENPEKYAFLESEGIGYLGYKELDSEAKEAWSWAFTHQDEYQYLKENGVTPEDYSVYRIPMLEFEDEEDSAYQWAFDNPEKATFGKVFGEGVKEYRRYASDLSAIKADKDEDGKTINGSAKEKKADYINGLDIDYGQKIILFKSLYKSDDTYNYDIIDYLNSRDDISYSEMETILVELGFEVSSDGSITW